MNFFFVVIDVSSKLGINISLLSAPVSGLTAFSFAACSPFKSKATLINVLFPTPVLPSTKML